MIPFEALYKIEERLEKLIGESGAIYGFVIDESGHVIAVHGDIANQDILALGTLLAGAFASSREVAKVLKEKSFITNFWQSIHNNVFTELVSNQWLLVQVFDRRTHVGVIRVLSRYARDDLEEIIEQYKLKESAPVIDIFRHIYDDDDDDDDDDNAAGSLARVRR